jgi:uncharacterized repeat protein (TIGR03803 family)
MISKQRQSDLLKLLTASALVVMLTQSGWAANKYRVLYSFKGGDDGASPSAALVFDAAGNLYGTTLVGGGTKADCAGLGYGCGTVFELTRKSNGKWSEHVLHRFQSGNDGAGPNGAMIFDTAGNLYGTTIYGGPYDGTVFELTPNSHGGWTERVLHRFTAGDGNFPWSGLFLDKTGNLYGTTVNGGAKNVGVVFDMTPHSGKWRESTLYSFCSRNDCSDGDGPHAELIEGSDGALYGTTKGGGRSSFGCNGSFVGCGTVFKLGRDSNGKWKESVIHIFTGVEGTQPEAGLVSDGKGNFYGTTTFDGAFGYGTVFELAPGSSGHWNYTVLYNFRGGINHISLNTGVVLDGAGNLYGANTYGGSRSCSGAPCGVVYRLAPGLHGKWKYTALHQFSGQDGGQPGGGLVFDKNGNLYGTAGVGGADGLGVVFEITP